MWLWGCYFWSQLQQHWNVERFLLFVERLGWSPSVYKRIINPSGIKSFTAVRIQKPPQSGMWPGRRHRAGRAGTDNFWSYLCPKKKVCALLPYSGSIISPSPSCHHLELLRFVRSTAIWVGSLCKATRSYTVCPVPGSILRSWIICSAMSLVSIEGLAWSCLVKPWSKS